MQLAHDSSFIVAGPSNSGKTEWTLRLLRERRQLFKRVPQRLLWCHGTTLSSDEQLRIRSSWEAGGTGQLHFIRGFPSELITRVRPYDLLIVDDLQSELIKSPEFTAIFTKYAHHTPLTCLYLCQNLFHRSDAEARSRSLCASYICLTRSIRDRTAVQSLGKQMFPKRSNLLVRAYEDATDNKPYSYLFIDLRQETVDILRLRSAIFPSDKMQIAYVPTDVTKQQLNL